jgi:hypothetical protein
MSGLLKFLLGGILGGIVGFFVSRRHLQATLSRPPVRRTVERPPAPVYPAVPAPPAGVEPAATPEPPVAPAAMVAPIPSIDAQATVATATSPEAVDTAANVISADELRLRIEETRRRIREELEEPFVLDVQPAVAPSPSSLEPTPLPVMREYPDVTPGEEPTGFEAVSQAYPVSTGYEDQAMPTADLRSRATLAVPVLGDTLRPTPSELEASISYDAMRARIEETRSRLKAEAGEARTPSTNGVDPGAGVPVTESTEAAESLSDVEARIDRLLSED